jgi:hypothetical protein
MYDIELNSLTLYLPNNLVHFLFCVELLLGSRVVWIREPNASNEAGVVRWLGQISGEDIAGIEFVSPLYW